jgi:hypothetical protein
LPAVSRSWATVSAALAGLEDDPADRHLGGALLGDLLLKADLPRPELERDKLLALVDDLRAVARPESVIVLEARERLIEIGRHALSRSHRRLAAERRQR